jgi:hypothetical protein
VGARHFFSRRSSGPLHASASDRPTGGAGVPIQFTGNVTKKGVGFWKVGGANCIACDDYSDTVDLGERLGWRTMTKRCAGWLRLITSAISRVQFCKDCSRLLIIDGHQVAAGDDTILSASADRHVRSAGGSGEDGTLRAPNSASASSPRQKPAPSSRFNLRRENYYGSVLLDQAEPGAYHPRPCA